MNAYSSPLHVIALDFVVTTALRHLIRIFCTGHFSSLQC